MRPVRSGNAGIQRLSEDYPDDVVILAVNCGESKEEVENLYRRMVITFPIALDENLEASNLYPATSIPLTLIVDEEGDIVYSSYGQPRRCDVRAL